MSRLRPQSQSSYGTPQGISKQFPSPVLAKRDPTTSDTGYSIAQLWTNTTTGNMFGLGMVAAGVATWTTLGTVSSTFTTITAATFTTSTAATAITLSSGNVFTGTGSNAAVGFTFTPKGTGGITLTTGALTLSSGNLVLTSGNATLTSGNLVLTSGNATLTSGNLTLTSGNATLALGDLTVTNGNVLLGTAGKGISLKSGANARIGQATLTAGTVVVANSSVTANTRFILTRSSVNGGTGAGSIGSLGAVANVGVGFTINSYSSVATVLATSDISIVDWILVESA